ncbi:NAP1-binding protein 2 [Trichomonascus vanleenenianus]|uniref:adaptor protein NBP2 n=1 Tax=Trichomonascus vanleenenianus TaxID=2268995 RepID=UPI003ECAB316
MTDVNQPRLEANDRNSKGQLSSVADLFPQFKSALPYTQVRDFAYPEFHPLHYGAVQSTTLSDEENDEPDGYGVPPNNYGDGPPWQEDADLASPIIRSHEVGDRISKEYEFSVASADEVHGRAVALFDFTPENDNEAPLREGQLIWISYRHGQGWLVAEDPETGETGLVPEEYVMMITGEEARQIQEQQMLDRAEDGEKKQASNLDSEEATNKEGAHNEGTKGADNDNGQALEEVSNNVKNLNLN